MLPACRTPGGHPGPLVPPLLPFPPFPCDPPPASGTLPVKQLRPWTPSAPPGVNLSTRGMNLSLPNKDTWGGVLSSRVPSFVSHGETEALAQVLHGLMSSLGPRCCPHHNGLALCRPPAPAGVWALFPSLCWPRPHSRWVLWENLCHCHLVGMPS